MLGDEVSKLSSLEGGAAFGERQSSPHTKFYLGADGAIGPENKDNSDEDSVKRPASSASQVAFQLAELSLAVQRLNCVLDRAIDRLSKLNAQR